MIRRKRIPRRQRFFLGCEGESEQGYAALLDRFAADHGLHVHIKVVNLQPAGDPLQLAKKAVAEASFEATMRGHLVARAVLLDSDRLADDHDRAFRAQQLLDQEGFISIWQRLDHEAFLLRHFAGHEHDNPPSNQTLPRLQAKWPGYRKGMPSSDLRRVLEINHVVRAAGVTPALSVFLHRLGLI